MTEDERILHEKVMNIYEMINEVKRELNLSDEQFIQLLNGMEDKNNISKEDFEALVNRIKL